MKCPKRTQYTVHFAIHNFVGKKSNGKQKVSTFLYLNISKYTGTLHLGIIFRSDFYLVVNFMSTLHSQTRELEIVS